MAEVAGVQDELLVLAAPRPCSERDAVEAPGEPLGHGEELQRREGLRQHGVGASDVVRVDHARLHSRSRQQHDADAGRRRIVLELPAEVDPAAPGHHDVQHDHVRARELDPVEGGRRVARLVDDDVEALERRAQERAQCRIVVHDENAQAVPPP